MTTMRRSALTPLLGFLLLAGCSTAQPAALDKEADACFRPRSFTQEVPQMYWGDPVRDPCWRFRRMPDR
ncbi:MAG TPA: hypothetical protein VIE44_02980 [Methylomirabilota bacterium]|jgi:hypothetical protein